MNTKTLNLINEAKEYLKSLQGNKCIELTSEQREAMNIYGDLMELKLGLYCYNDKSEPEELTLLKKRYEHITLSNIEQATSEVGNELNKLFDDLER
jgi:hypothetical protein